MGLRLRGWWYRHLTRPDGRVGSKGSEGGIAFGDEYVCRFAAPFPPGSSF